jgi:hypothetical protein
MKTFKRLITSSKNQSGSTATGFLLLMLASMVYMITIQKQSNDTVKIGNGAQSVEMMMDGMVMHYLTYCEEDTFPAVTLEKLVEDGYILPSTQDITALTDTFNIELKNVGFQPVQTYLKAKFTNVGVAERLLSATTDGKRDPDDTSGKTIIWSRAISNNLETSPNADALMDIFGDSTCF